MWYKFGIEKVSLRTGKMLGLAAGLLVLLQLPLAGRLKFLDRIFSLPGFEAHMTIDRLAYHVGDGNYYDMGVLGKDVDVLITLEVTRKK